MARTVQMGVACAKLAFADSGIDRGQLDSDPVRRRDGVEPDPDRAGRLAPRRRPAPTDERPASWTWRKWGEAGLREVQPLWMLKYLPNMVACHTSIFLDAQGPNNIDHRQRRGRPAGPRRGGPHPPPRRGRLLPRRRRRQQDQPAQPARHACSPRSRSGTTSRPRRSGRSTATATAT